MLDHHKETIERLINEYKDDSRFLGMIIGGSVAKNLSRFDSDIDFMIIANDEEYSRRSKERDFFINRTDLATYEKGFVDGKIIDMGYLVEVAKRGNEPTRAAFDGAIIGFSNIDGLDDIIESIQAYPEESRDKKITSFYSMSFIQNWLMGEASRHGNLYTMTRAASQLALFSGRLILAHNRVFFPYHKWFLAYLDKCEEKPEHLIENISELLKNPNSENSEKLFQSVKAFKDWGISDLEAFTWFFEEVEMSWMDGSASLEDL